jgi:hypothetical protein
MVHDAVLFYRRAMDTRASGTSEGRWSTLALPPRKHRLRWLLLAGLGAALIGAGIFFHVVVQGRLVPLSVISAGYMARVACACHFGAGRSVDSCYGDAEPGMERVRLTPDPARATMTASVFLLASRTARYTTEQGCVLVR